MYDEKQQEEGEKIEQQAASTENTEQSEPASEPVADAGEVGN